MSGFIDFANVKAHCSIEQAAKFLGLQTTEERSQLRALCPACGNGGPRRSSSPRPRTSFIAFPRKPVGTKSPWSPTSKA